MIVGKETWMEEIEEIDRLLPAYGELLAEKIRTVVDGAIENAFYKFVLDRGWKFRTEEALKTAYLRFCKSNHGVILTQEEFLDEAEPQNADEAKEVYNVLSSLVEEMKLNAAEVYQYARFSWCLNDASSIVAYQREHDKWEVNNCSTVTTEEDAKEAINCEWGFETSRVEIIGTPYYDATDWQFIRFDCGFMSWLWKNGSLYQVYSK